MEVMFHTPKERKSKSLDNIKKEYKEKKMRKGHVARRKMGRNLPLELSWMRFSGREVKWRKRKRKKRKERRRKVE